VRRLRDPDDRRGVLVEPTEKGLHLRDETVGVQGRKEALVISALNKSERHQLNTFLRRVMIALEEREGEKPDA
jgi:DNA-binding MarR family transcriptional regulator